MEVTAPGHTLCVSAVGQRQTVDTRIDIVTADLIILSRITLSRLLLSILLQLVRHSEIELSSSRSNKSASILIR